MLRIYYFSKLLSTSKKNEQWYVNEFPSFSLLDNCNLCSDICVKKSLETIGRNESVLNPATILPSYYRFLTGEVEKWYKIKRALMKGGRERTPGFLLPSA